MKCKQCEFLERELAELKENFARRVYALESEIKRLQEIIEGQAEVIAHLKQIIYGRKTEKLASLIGDEAGKEGEQDAVEFTEEDAPADFDYETEDEGLEKKSNKGKNGGGKRKPPPKNAVHETIIHDLAEHEKTCPHCRAAMSSCGEEVNQEMEYIPAMIKVITHVRQKYACKNCGRGVKIAPPPIRPLNKCIAGPGLLAYVIASKFQMHIPLYRQSAMWERLGVELSRATLCNWVLKAAAPLERLCKALRKDLVSRDYVCADETTIQVLKEPERKADQKSYMWFFVSGEDDKPRIVYCKYSERRNAEVPLQVLEGFRGILQTDDYAGYNAVRAQNGLIDVGCWMHGRRGFCDVLKLTKNKSGKSRDAIVMIGKLYLIEREAKEAKLSFDQIKELRNQKARPIIEKEILPFMKDLQEKAPPKHKLGRSASYIVRNTNQLTEYLNDGRIHIDNGLVENIIRQLALGRRNWLFMGSPEGARAAEMYYSIICTCQENNINAELFLRYYYTVLPTLGEKEEVTHLLPYRLGAKTLEDFACNGYKLIDTS